jgi:hypothetical protein
MPAIAASLIDALCSGDDAARRTAAEQIYNLGVAPALQVARQWAENAELAGLLGAVKPVATVGLAVFPEKFARIRAAAHGPDLADVPPDQDAQEFELDFPGGVSLDILTTREAGGSGAIARYLGRFGEGVQQVEFRCKNVDRATEILKVEFGCASVYPATRAGANGTRINFFLVPVENEKVLIELYEAPRA